MSDYGIRPLGRAVLLAPVEEKMSEIIHVPESVTDRNMTIDTQAIVIAAGPEAWKNESQPRAWPGDKVLVAKYAGHIAVDPKTGKKLRLVNDNDIFAGI